jgi:hypothetical protein
MAGRRDFITLVCFKVILGQWGPRIRVKGTREGIVERSMILVGLVSTVFAVSISLCGGA